MNHITIKNFFCAGFALAFLSHGSSASATVIEVDFSSLPSGTVITNQFDDLGVQFTGWGNPVFVGGVFFGSGRSVAGLTHSIVGPFPGDVNGIRIFFVEPVSYLSFEVHANRIGASARVLAYSYDHQLLQSDYFYAPDYYKGHYEQSFTTPVSRIDLLSSEPNQTPVGLREFEFEVSTVPEPASLALVAIGLAGLGSTRKKKICAK